MTLRNRLLTLSCSALCLAALHPWPAWADDGGGKGPQGSGDGAAAAVAEAIDRLFEQADSSRVPTGLLLEKGAIFAGGLIDAASQPAGEATPSGEEFDQAYHELRAGSVGAQLPSLDALNARAQGLRHRYGAVPVTFAAVRYTTIRDDAAGYPMVDQVFQLPAGPIGDEGLYAANRVWARQLGAFEDRFVVPAELLALNGVDARDLTDLSIRVDSYPEQPIELDRPFELDHRPALADKVRLTLKARVDGEWIKGSSVLPVEAMPTGVRPPLPPPTVPATVGCQPRFWAATDETGTHTLPVFDLTDSVVGAPFNAPWDEDFQTSQRGELFVRIVPGDGRVGVDGSNSLCDVELVNPVVVVDGIDIFNDRGFENIQNDFGSSLKKLQAFGFDLIIIDYLNGRDWIERNGEALRALMVDRMPLLPATIATRSSSSTSWAT
ncbi:MAG: hypothetical protein AAFX50_07145, partial [Acidobacteriota bacterium]